MTKKSPHSRRNVLAGLCGVSLAAFAAGLGLAPMTAALAQSHDEGGHSGGGHSGGGKGRSGKGGSGGHDDGGHDDGGHDDGGDDGGDDDGGDDGGHDDGGGKGQGGKGGRGGRPGDGVIRQGRGHSIEDRVFRWPEG